MFMMSVDWLSPAETGSLLLWIRKLALEFVEGKIPCSLKKGVWASLWSISRGKKAGSCTGKVSKLGTWQPVPAPNALYCSFLARRGEKAEVLELGDCRAGRS